MVPIHLDTLNKQCEELSEPAQYACDLKDLWLCIGAVIGPDRRYKVLIFQRSAGSLHDSDSHPSPHCRRRWDLDVYKREKQVADATVCNSRWFIADDEKAVALDTFHLDPIASAAGATRLLTVFGEDALESMRTCGS